MSGSLVAWKIVPAVSETWRLQRLHWFSPAQPPRVAAVPAGRAGDPCGQRSFASAARHCSSVPNAARNSASLSPLTRAASRAATAVPPSTDKPAPILA